MYKVIIAEDEMFVRLGIKMSVNWEKLGMEVIADVENGQQAFRAWEESGADVIITDIKMPVMDGIELIRKVRKKDSRTRFVILSCLEEFDIVREAISLGVSDYVTKLTMSQEDMERVLEKVGRELSVLDQKQEKKEQAALSTKEFSERMLHYLYYRLDAGKECRRQFETRLAVGEDIFTMAVMEIDDYEKSRKLFEDAYGSILDFAVENILKEVLAQQKHLVITEKNGRFILIMGWKGQTGMEKVLEAQDDLLLKIREVMIYYVKSSVTFGMDLEEGSYELLYELHHRCSCALEKKFFYGLNKDYIYTAKEDGKCRNFILRKMQRTARELALTREETSRFLEAAEAFGQHENPDTIRSWFEHTVNGKLCELLPPGKRRYQVTEMFLKQIRESQTLDQVLEIYRSCVDYLKKPDEETGLSKPVRDILSYVRIHYAEEITLDQMAKMVELSRTYVCGLFKKEIGVNLTSYIVNCRIEKAKELLRTTNLKSYEVAEKVGFEDESYFSRAFKKMTGESPNAYKKNARSE